jgi:hypothetical protein
MKSLALIFTILALAAPANAGIIGWFTSDTRDWDFVQKTGGIRISAPIQKDGKIFLPVEYCVQGLVAITCKPTLLNSGLAIRKIDLKKKDDQLVIRVVTQLVEKGSDTAQIHYVDLSDIHSGSYEVYYETAGDPRKYLGKVEIK